MLIEGKLPEYYLTHAQHVTDYYTNKHANGENTVSVHYWINSLDEPIYDSIQTLRTAPIIQQKIQEAYGPTYSVIPVHASDEVYISVDPSKRKNSDIILSDCHYDAPFKYVPQCGNRFIRVILALNENNTTYTTIENITSCLSTLDFNGMDYNNDFHCVKGYIPPGKIRILLKLHFVCVHRASPKSCTQFTRNLNNDWTHISRELMRNSSNPTTVSERLLSFTILSCGRLYNNIHYVIVVLTIVGILLYIISFIKFHKTSMAKPSSSIKGVLVRTKTP